MEIEREIKQARFRNEFHKVVVNILFTSGWLSVTSTQMLKPFGVSPQQFNILRILRGQHPNPATVRMLQERMLDKMSNASRLVEKLRLKGLVERHENEKDRRQVDVKITQKGLDLLLIMDKEFENFEDGLAHLTPAEARELNRLLDKFRG